MYYIIELKFTILLMHVDILLFEIYFIIKCVSCALQSRYFLSLDLLIITVSTVVTGQNTKVIACGNEF